MRQLVSLKPIEKASKKINVLSNEQENEQGDSLKKGYQESSEKIHSRSMADLSKQARSHLNWGKDLNVSRLDEYGFSTLRQTHLIHNLLEQSQVIRQRQLEYSACQAIIYNKKMFNSENADIYLKKKKFDYKSNQPIKDIISDNYATDIQMIQQIVVKDVNTLL